MAIAAFGGHLDSENWLLAYLALFLGWAVVVAYGVVRLLRSIGFVVGVAVLAAATGAMLILGLARAHGEILQLGWFAVLLAWVVAGAYGVVRLFVRLLHLSAPQS